MTLPFPSMGRGRALQAAATRPVASPPRRFTLLLPGEPLVCPCGHHMGKNLWALGSDGASGYRCQFRTSPSTPPCAATVFVLGMEDGMRVSFDATPRELFEMEAGHMTIAQMRDHLGLSWASEAAA